MRKIPENAGQFAHYTFSTTRRVYTFTFTDLVIHYLIEDFFGHTSGPWNSSEAGKEAWEEFMAANLHTLPNIAAYNLIEPQIVLTSNQLKVLSNG